MKQFILFSIIFTLFLGCSQPRQGQITILHTNDMHSQFTPTIATWIQQTPKPQIGGMVALEYYIQQQRQKYPHHLLVDGGDISTGTLLSKIEYKGAFNGGFVEMMNLIGYDAYTIGNHEFDDGQDNLQALIDLMQFDVLSSNLFINDVQFAPKAYEIYKINGIRVGVIGILLENLAGVAAGKNLVGVEIKNAVETAQQYIDKIDPKTDIIIVLTHQGKEEDFQLAEQLSNADIIIGGHSHTRLNDAVERNGMLIVQAGSKTRYLGRLTVDVENDQVVAHESELVPVWVDSVKTANPDMEAIVNSFKEKIDAEYNQVIGELLTPWKQNSNGESNLGNFLCDVLRETVETDIAILNSGGIRKSVPAGPVTKQDIIEILPFTNYIVTFEMTGEQILRMVDENINAAITGAYGINQISGLSYTYRVINGTGERQNAYIHGKPISPEKTYTCASVDFLYNQMKDRNDYNLTEMQQSPYIISDLITKYILKNPQIDSQVEQRIQKIK